MSAEPHTLAHDAFLAGRTPTPPPMSAQEIFERVCAKLEAERVDGPAGHAITLITDAIRRTIQELDT